jgi:hypothetical protein
MLPVSALASLGSPLATHLGALTVARSHLLSSFKSSGLLSRSFASGSNGNSKHSSVYITDTDGNVAANTPLLLGLVNYFEVGRAACCCCCFVQRSVLQYLLHLQCKKYACGMF